MAKSGYDFYLGRCLLPITPEKLQIKINNANKTVTLINEGQINLLKTPELTDIEFECTIPQVRYPFAVYTSGFSGAAQFLNYFESLKSSKQPFQFIVSRTLPNGIPLFSTNIKVSLEDYTITESAKQGFDLAVKIRLKQFRNYGSKSVTIKSSEDSEETTASVTPQRSTETSPAPKKTAQTYTVQKGDCLWNISKKFYGSGAKYVAIYDANSDIITNKNLIYPGQVLTIPVL